MTHASKVPVLVIEDTTLPYIDWDMPRSHSSHYFTWHAKFEETIQTRDEYVEWAAFLGTELAGSALIFCDLQMPAIDVDDNECRQLREWLPRWDHDLRINPGLYLASVALQNPNWHGMLIVTSIVANDSVKAVVKELARGIGNPRVKVEQAGDSISIASGKIRLDEGIKKYLENYGDIGSRLWPAETEGWYEDDSVVPHNFALLEDLTRLKACKEALKGYLGRLFMAEPPLRWFEKDEEFRKLHNELKHLVGKHAAVQGGGRRNLTLGGALILLGALTGVGAGHWIHEVSWQKTAVPILPKQTPEQARRSILTLARLFECWKAHDDTGRPLVTRVNLPSKKLQIWLDFDCREGKPERPSLLEKVTNFPDADGEVYTHYRSFLIESAKGKVFNNDHDSREARCVVNVRPTAHPTNLGVFQTLVEIIPCS